MNIFSSLDVKYDGKQPTDLLILYDSTYFKETAAHFNINNWR